MSQTTISAGGQSVGDPGDPADSGPKDFLSGFNADAVQMPFGYGVAINTNTGDFYSLPTGMSQVYPVVGVLARRANYMPAITVGSNTIGNQGGSGLLQYAPLNIGVKGRFLVPVESGVVRGQRAWCRGVATGSLTQGSWRGAGLNASPSGVGGGGAIALGASYFIDCTRAGVFRSASFTAADGSTLVAVLEVDFTTGVI